MNKTILALTLVTSISVSTASVAETGQSYFGAGYHSGSYNQTGLPKASLNALKIKGGKYITDRIAIEGHLALGMGSDRVTVTTFGLDVDVDVELENAISVFLKGDFPLLDSTTIYGLIGATKGELTVSSLGSSVTEDGSGLSYGLGVDVNIREDLLVGGEYIMYFDESDFDYTGFNISITKLF